MKIPGKLSIIVSIIGVTLIISSCQYLFPKSNSGKVVTAPDKGKMSRGKEKVKRVETIERKTAEIFLQNMLKGMLENNYAAYSRNFSDTLKMLVTEDKFTQENIQSRNSIGKFESMSFIGEIKKSKRTTFLWKARYSKTKDEILLKLVIGKIDGKYKVLNFLEQ